MKGFNSNYSPAQGGFSLLRDAKKIDQALGDGEKIMIDTSKMTRGDVAALKAEGEKRGWGSSVVWHP